MAPSSQADIDSLLEKQAPVVVIDAVFAAELTAQHYKRLDEQLLGLEVRQQDARWLVQDRCLLWGSSELSLCAPPLTPPPASRHMNILS